MAERTARRLDLALDGPAFAADAVVIGARVHEEISVPTKAVVEIITAEDIDLDEALRAPVHLSILEDDRPVRHFHLIVVGVEHFGLIDAGRHHIRIELAHELSLLRHRADVRMFQEMKADEIVGAVLSGATLDMSHYRWSLMATPALRTYCVQYRERDFDFVSRLLEEEGIFYFIRDDEGGPRVTFADHNGACEPIQGPSSLTLARREAHGAAILDFELETVAIAERFGVGDYNPDTPDLDLTAYSEASDEPYGELFEYAAGHRTPAEGSAIARIRMEEVAATRVVGSGTSTSAALVAGATFELDGVHDGLAGEYLLSSVDHLIRVRGAAEGQYENRFTCIPKATTCRPRRRAPKALVRGVHSAVVTGPAGSEIHTDERGSMKAKFFWDVVGQSDDTSSPWIRVGQFPVGASMALARVGWEMAVAYFDGDPDRPHAFARLYNAEKISPYGYPAAKTRMALQTSSSPGGGGTNEIRMEDGAGGMEFFLNASKDYDGETKNDKTETIAGSQTIDVGTDSGLIVGTDQSVTIGGDLTGTVSGGDSLSVSGSRTESIGGSETVTISDNLTAIIAGSDAETTAGTHTTLAGLGVAKTSMGTQSLTVGGSMISAAGLGCAMAVAGAKSETVGGVKLVASGGTITESVIGAYACTVGGACVQAAGGNRTGTTSSSSALTVGGVIAATAGGKVAIEASSVSITVAGVANLLGGGGIVNLTPGSATLTGIVVLDASGSIKITGNPNLVG